MDKGKHRGHRPFLLRPTGKDYLWGGGRLNDTFAKNINMSPLAETWECSAHPDGPSYVSGGEFDGQELAEVLKQHPEYLGSHPAAQGGLPVLIKFIDASRDLSVQVHPTDEYAALHEDGQRGKTEMWYVLDAKPGAGLVYGLNRGVGKDEIRHAIEAGTLERFLQRVPVKRDDVFFVEAGTIHALGAGALVAEIQESSNLTYRLFDYNRVDKDGKKRELHVEKALDVADLRGMAEPRQPMRVLKYRPGVASELLCRCRYFEVHRMMVNTERRQAVYYQSDGLSFRVLLCLGGCGVLCFHGEAMKVYQGDCVFVPANSARILLHGQMRFLDVRC